MLRAIVSGKIDRCKACGGRIEEDAVVYRSDVGAVHVFCGVTALENAEQNKGETCKAERPTENDGGNTQGSDGGANNADENGEKKGKEQEKGKEQSAQLTDGEHRKMWEAIEKLSKKLEAKPKAKKITLVNEKGENGRTQEGLLHKQYADILRIVQSKVPLYLHGNPGGGKSTMVRQIFEHLGVEMSYMTISPKTSLGQLFGMRYADGTYIESEFVKRYRDGGAMLIEEGDATGAEMQAMLNTAIENGEGSFPCGMVKQHEGFFLVLTGNTDGNGPTEQFPDRRPFDSAFKDRFIFKEFLYDDVLEVAIAESITEKGADVAKWVQEVRKYCADNYPEAVITPRATYKTARLLSVGVPFMEAVRLAVLKTAKREMIDRVVEAVTVPAVLA